MTLDLQGATLVITLTRTNDAGVRLLSGATLRNGTVRVLSRGTPGSQAAIHAPVLVGALYGENPSSARISRFEAPSGWRIENMTLHSDKRVMVGGSQLGAAGIAIMGGANHGSIDTVTIEDSDRMAGGVMIDWGFIGPISSGDVARSAQAYRSGLGWTAHPHSITIENLTIGRLTKPSRHGDGSFGLRISGAHDILARHIRIERVTESAIFYTAGDLGYEFARGNDRSRAHRGTVIQHVHVQAVDGGHLIRTNSHADNISRAAERGYRPTLAPIAETDLTISNVSGTSLRPRPHTSGVRVDHQHGGTLRDISVAGFDTGFWIDEQVNATVLERPRAIASKSAAFMIGHPHRPPSNISIAQPIVEGAGIGAQRLAVSRSTGVVVRGGNARLEISEQARGTRVTR
ncbi:hypothetical protein [Qipengyuania oceanensis]|uniref:Right-handed parallel beta-helix repeat-containing protein n=1 Tax=Qipengyuania oceanensis TaxID=1463597 RepID=A0A844YGN2_9SPHN|nr:hypothetical protein [Qipengyuania oceanensis]MXO63097.1 hypothetical protein [Qipengyuania oceanensis]